MKVVIDMNLSPEWKEAFTDGGWAAAHWTEIGDARAADEEIMSWAREHDHLVFTQDLDFGALLAASGGRSPSVVQLRCEENRPGPLAELVLNTIRRFENELKEGALLTINPRRARVTLLPL